jgi:hypothetical protein
MSSSHPDDELVVPLGHPRELLEVDPTVLFEHDAPLVPGATEIVDELLGRPRVGRKVRIVIELPAATVGPGTADSLAAALARYCHGRHVAVDREARKLWREGLNSLRAGSVLFLLGLVLSSSFLAESVPPLFQELLGNGVFLVIAWVGLWYPFDSLFFARLPLRREMRILRAIPAMPVEVRAR